MRQPDQHRRAGSPLLIRATARAYPSVLSTLIVENTVHLTRSAVACPSGEMHCWVRCSVLCCDGVVMARWC